MRDYNKDFKFKYVLNKVHGKIFIRKLITFDTETHDNNQKFTLGSLFNGEQFLLFNDKIQMRDYLLDKRYQNTFLCATNLQFDFCAIEDMRNFFTYSIISRGGRFIQVKKQTKYKNKNHENHDTVFSNVFIDSLNHFAGSVESAGKIVGLKKMDSPYRLGKEPSMTSPAMAVNDKGEPYKVVPEMTEYEYLRLYNQRDSEVTYKLMNFLQSTYNSLGCEMKTTISSTALDLWKRKYLPCEIIREDYILGKNIKDEIFKTYYGGRTEIFGRGLITSSKDTQWKLFDINSLYPSVMCFKFPLPQSIVKPDEMTVDNIVNYEGFSDVEIECDYMFYTLLPYRDFKRGKLIFPWGHWRSSYTHAELRKAIEIGYRVKKIFTQYIYTKTFYPFKDYVIDLYQKRLEYKRDGNPMEVVVKLLLNCFSYDTNVWCVDGLKNIQDVKVGDKVYSVNPDTLMTEIKEVTKTYEYDYSGEMYHIKNSRMDCLVTPNHRFLCKRHYDSNYIFKEIKDVVSAVIPKIFSNIDGKMKNIIDLHKYLSNNDCYDSKYWYPTGIRGQQRFGINLKYDFKKFISLIGWFISEGSLYFRNGCYRVIIHQQKDKYRDEIENLLKTLGIIYTKCEKSFSIYDKILYKFFDEEIGKYQINRKIPRWIFELDSSYLKILYNSMMSGDGYKGTIVKNKSGKSMKRGQSIKYTTNSEQLSKDFQQLCIHIGIHTKIIRDKKTYGNQRMKCYRIYENHSKTFMIETKRKCKLNVFKIKNPYNKVYCIEVKDNHTVIVERNGKIITTGQSLYGKLAQRDFVEYIWFDISEMSSQEFNDYLDSNNTTVYGNIGFKRVIKECDTNFIFPILASYVTSYGRLRLYDYIIKYNAVYCDTDSIITSSEVPQSSALGDMKLEDTLKKAILIRPKLYMKQNEFDKVKIKVKGVPKVTVESFEKILQQYRVYFNKFVKPSESIRRGWNVNEIRQDSKEIDLEDNKREWSKKFDYTSFDFDSKPVYVDTLEQPIKKSVLRKTVRERQLISEHDYKKNKDKLRKQFLESDLFDLKSVGEDITPEEFVENEEWFDKRGL